MLLIGVDGGGTHSRLVACDEREISLPAQNAAA